MVLKTRSKGPLQMFLVSCQMWKQMKLLLAMKQTLQNIKSKHKNQEM